MLHPALSSSRRNRSNSRRRNSHNVLGFERLESKNLLASLTASTAEEFVDAIAMANADTSIRKIEFAESADVIEIDDTVTYTGSQSLKIDGNDVVIKASSESDAPFDLFAATGGSNLTLQEISFEGGLDGVLVQVPETATGRVSVRLFDVSISGASEFGLHIDDLAGSDASIRLNMRDSSVTGNGVGALDFDGIRVDERGDGGIKAFFRNTHIDANGGDGLELDEGGDGDVKLTMIDSTLNENGFFNEEDLDDGLDIDEAGPGGIKAYLRNVNASDNLDEGIDFDEEDEGGVSVNLVKVNADGNRDEGIKVSEEGDGGVWGRLYDVSASENGDDGIEFEEAEAGNLQLWFKHVHADGNGDSGIQAEEAGAGNFSAFMYGISAQMNDDTGVDLSESDQGRMNFAILDAVVSGNDGDGLAASESGDGSLYGFIYGLDADDNSDYGVNLSQEDAGGGFAVLLDEAFSGNGAGPIMATGINLFD